MDALLRVADLVKGYGEGSARVDVLRGIDVSLARGELCAMLGPSGSGKSTFINLIGDLERADAGNILVDGSDLTSLSDRALGE
jgi:putative ABC transport system ATP-binding protein